jgi:hypothetical protein
LPCKVIRFLLRIRSAEYISRLSANSLDIPICHNLLHVSFQDIYDTPTNLIIIRGHAEGEVSVPRLEPRSPSYQVANKKRAPESLIQIGAAGAAVVFNPPFFWEGVAYNLGVLAVCVFTLTQPVLVFTVNAHCTQKKNRSDNS